MEVFFGLQVAHASMKDTSWGYYSTGSMDEWTKCVSTAVWVHSIILLDPECLLVLDSFHEFSSVNIETC